MTRLEINLQTAARHGYLFAIVDRATVHRTRSAHCQKAPLRSTPDMLMLANFGSLTIWRNTPDCPSSPVTAGL